MARGPELKVKFQMLARFNRLAEMARVDPRIKSGDGHDGFCVRHPAIFSQA
jgi:hypothetical protein